jgi:hypothetical protein
MKKIFAFFAREGVHFFHRHDSGLIIKKIEPWAARRRSFGVSEAVARAISRIARRIT